MAETRENRRGQLAYLFKKQGGKCYICGELASLDFDGGKVGQPLSAVSRAQPSLPMPMPPAHQSGDCCLIVKLTFTDFRAAYPKRRGSNPWAPAEKRFYAAVKSGIDPERIINSAKAYADELRELHKIGTEFVAQAQTWLNQRRWDDYAPDPGSVQRNAKIETEMAARGWTWNGEKWIKVIHDSSPNSELT